MITLLTKRVSVDSSSLLKSSTKHNRIKKQLNGIFITYYIFRKYTVFINNIIQSRRNLYKIGSRTS